jgi:DNA-binding NtrC family response regulator
VARILLIDDEDLVRSTLRYALERAGHNVTEAGNGREGMSALERGDIDLVITDILMPEMEGIETIRATKKVRPELKVIAMSGAAAGAVDFLQLAGRLGADEILRKPFGTRALVDAVDRCLAQARGAAGGGSGPCLCGSA